ncbi:MAG: hypothetical protein WB495_22005 [Xanthobacteraceae bacterium]
MAEPKFISALYRNGVIGLAFLCDTRHIHFGQSLVGTLSDEKLLFLHAVDSELHHEVPSSKQTQTCRVIGLDPCRRTFDGCNIG